MSVQVYTPDCYLCSANLGFTIFFSFATSFTLPSKRKVKGTSSPPCNKSVEYFLFPVSQVKEFPLLRKSEQARDIAHDRWPMIVPSFLTATAYLSLSLTSSLSH